MILFGMINWTFTWLRADGPLTFRDMAPIVTGIFLDGVRGLLNVQFVFGAVYVCANALVAWRLLRAFPVRYVAGPLDARGGDVAMEELTLSCERLESE